MLFDRSKSPLVQLGPVIAAPAAVRLGVLLGRPVEADLEGIGVALVSGPDDLAIQVELTWREGREIGELRVALEDVRVLGSLRTAQGTPDEPRLVGDSRGTDAPGLEAVPGAREGLDGGESRDLTLALEMTEVVFIGLADAIRTLTGEAVEVRVLGGSGPESASGPAAHGPGPAARDGLFLLAVRVRDLFQTSLTLTLPDSLRQRLEKAAPPAPTVARPLRLPTLADGRGDAWVPTGSEGFDRLEGGQALRRVRDVPITITVELGRTIRRVEEIVTIAPGTVLELDRLAGEPLDVYANQEWVARGEVVVVDENFAVRITQVGGEPEGQEGAGKVGMREGEAPWGPR